MNITVEKLPDCKASIRVQVPADKVETQRSAIAKAYHQNATLPGFRPGKAPLAMIARRYGKQIEEELRQRLIGEGYQEGRKQDGLNVISPLDVETPAFQEDGSFTFTVQVLTAPDFELPNYKGLTLKVPKVAITDENVEQTLQSIRERLADYPEVTDRALAAGDVAIIDYHAFVEGAPIRELAPEAPEQLQHGHDYGLLVKEPNFLAGFTDGLVGMALDEERKVTVTLPEDFAVKEVAGKEVVYEVKLKGIRSVVLPEVDDALAVRTGMADDLPALRAKLRERMEQDLANRLEQAKREQIIEILNNAVDFGLPKELVDQATQRRVQELVDTNQKRGVTDDEIVSRKDEIVAAAGDQAVFDVKTEFILQRIARAEDVKVTEGEVARVIAAYAERSGASQKQLMKMVRDASLVNRVSTQLLISKTVELIKSAAVIEEVEQTEENAAAAAESTGSDATPAA